MINWQQKYQQEMEQARIARDNGNDGKARVCARRAAGVLIGEYLEQAGIPSVSTSAYDRLKYLNSLPGFPDRVYQACQNLLTRVTPEYQLPAGIDVFSDVELLRNELFGD